jgi:hypothetical protein
MSACSPKQTLQYRIAADMRGAMQRLACHLDMLATIRACRARARRRARRAAAFGAFRKGAVTANIREHSIVGTLPSREERSDEPEATAGQPLQWLEAGIASLRSMTNA